MSVRKLMEIPIITQDHNVLNQRYKINNDLSVTTCHDHDSKDGSPSSAFRDGNDDEWQRRLQGCAATLLETTKGDIVRSTALAEEPYVLSVARVSSSSLQSSVEIDLSHLDFNILGDVIKTFIFEETYGSSEDMEEDEELMDASYDATMDQRDPSYRILLVDAQTNVLTFEVQLNADNSVPVFGVKSKSMGSILANHNIQMHHHGRYHNITSSQITALDSGRIVVALSPHILCININMGTATQWSKESCLYNRRKSISGVLKSAGGLLLGKASDEIEEEFVDEDTVSLMPSTAVLCAFRRGGDLLVSSLHADGTIRLWTLSSRCQNLTYPKQVHVLNGEDNINGMSGSNSMPPPHAWSSSSDSLGIEGHSYVDVSTGQTEFVLAVSIRVAERMGVDRVSSPCHLTTLVGSFGSNGKINQVQSSRISVPDAVDSIKSMNFVHSSSSWELRTLVLSVPDQSVFADTSLYASLSHTPLRKTMIVVYGSKSHQPLITQSANTLDDIAEQEREKIIHECRIISGGGILDEKQDEGKDTHLRELDAWYMKRIFRSANVQTIGLSSATSGTIRRALRQVIPSLCFDNDDQRDNCGKTVELETVTMMNKWAKFEETRSSANSLRKRGGILSTNQFYSPSPKKKLMNPTPSHGISTYRNFLQEPVSPSVTPEIRDDSSSDDGDMIGSSYDESKRRVQEHHSRWRKLLLAIHHEESKLLAPLAFASFPLLINSKNGHERVDILIRGGVTSTTSLSITIEPDKLTSLDAALVKMLEKIEQDSELNNKEMIVALETKIWCLISGAKLIFQEERDSLISFVNDLIPMINAEGWEDLSNHISGILNGMNDDDLKSWLSTPLSSSQVFGPSGLTNDIGTYDNTADASVVLPSAFRLSQQYLAACRRLALARYLCIAQVEAKGFNLFGPDAERMSLVTYLHSVATTWACIQKVPQSSEHTEEMHQGSKITRVTPLMTFSTSNSSLSSTTEKSVTKPRSSTLLHHEKSHGSSILGVVLSEIFKSNQLNSSRSADSCIIDLSKALVINAFPRNKQGLDLPELSILSSVRISDKARLHLRLLSPHIAFLPAHMNTKNRIKLVAEGVLCEVNSLAKGCGLKLERISELQEHASHLLKKGPVLTANPTYLGIFFEAMTDLPSDWASNRSVTENFIDKSLVEILFTVLNEPSAQCIHVSDEDIRSLSKMESVRTLFVPWITASMNSNSNATQMIVERLASFVEPNAEVEVIQHALKVLLLISTLLERVTVLEKHSSLPLHPKVGNSLAKVLISAINDVIENIQNHARVDDFRHFQEYAAIWSSLFRHSLQGRCWDDAFESCLSHPVKERRIINFKRLVLAIVKAGALESLLNKMTFLIIDDNTENAAIDLYELASKTLSDAAVQCASNEIDRFCDSSLSDVDYRGCLYSLHTAYEDWRRSCQALDFLAEETALRRLNVNITQVDAPRAEESDTHNIHTQIMDDLVLSAVASAQLIQLVEKPEQRYFVSGEVAPIPAPDSNLGENVSTKTSSQNGASGNQRDTDNMLDRVSRLHTERNLLLRAKRLISLHTLQQDAYAPESPLDIFQSSDTAIIDALSRLGYYHHAISFARCKQENKEGGKIAGRDLLIDAVCHMLHNCLAPIAVNLLRTPLSEDTKIDLEAQGCIISRPTMNQLRLFIEDGRISSPSDSWQQLEVSSYIERGTFAMNLLRLHVERFSKEDSKVAIELAEKLLEIHEAKVRIPRWLNALILGEIQSDGLFANNRGNPTALLNLFIKFGLYIDACQLVRQVLLGGNEREQNTTSRLPEKGNIDYVPYDAIDRLWNLIETHIQSSKENSIENQKLLDARKSVESALEKHFQLMHVSEMGMLSARTLHSRGY